MTFSLSKCPPKQRKTKSSKSSKTKSSSNYYEKVVEEKNQKVNNSSSISSILEGFEQDSTDIIRRPRRQRQRRSNDLPIPSFRSRTTAKLDFLNDDDDDDDDDDSPKKMVVVTNREITKVHQPDTKVPPQVDTKKLPPMHDSDDSDSELLQSAPVFRKQLNITTTTTTSHQTIMTENKKGSVTVVSTEDQVNSCDPSCAIIETNDRKQRAATDNNDDSSKVVNDGVMMVETAAAIAANDDGFSAKHECTVEVAPQKAVATTTRPSQERLFQSLDQLYRHADIKSVTVKDIIQALEAEYTISLDKKTRKSVKTRLTNLIAGKVVPASPLSSSTSAAAGNGNDKDRTTSKHKQSHIQEDEKLVEKPSTIIVVQQSTISTTKPVVVEEKQPTVEVVHQSRTTEQKVNDRSRPMPDVPAAKPQTKKHPPRTTRKLVQGEAIAAIPSKPPAAKQTRKRTRKGTCSLCTTCSCANANNNNDDAAVRQNFGDQPIARTEIEVEKSLIRRQKKLEKTVDKYESDLDLVTRDLKRHRRALVKRRGAQLPQHGNAINNDSRFLPDVDAWDAHLEQVNHGVISTLDVNKTQRKMFGEVKGGQPTLTQMMGCSSSKKTSSVVLEPILEEPSQESDTLEEDEPSIMSSQVEDELEEPAEPVQRVTWRDGKREAEEAEQPIWSAVSCGSKSSSETQEDSAWDRMFFKRMQPQSRESFDELLGLFDAEVPGLSMQPQSEASEQVNVSQLSQSAQELAVSLESKVTADPARHSKIEGACPNWKENIRFALRQRGGDDINGALENIRESKAKLDKMKEEFLSAWKRQQTVLQLYEMSLAASLERSNGGSGEQQQQQLLRDTPFEASTDIESDAETVTDFSPMSSSEDVATPDVMKSLKFELETQNEEG